MPCALELWRRSPGAIAAVSLLSPPPPQFFCGEGEGDNRIRTAVPEAALPPDKRASFVPQPALQPEAPSPPGLARNSPPRFALRRTQRLAWAFACTPLGNYAYRRLRGGKPRGKRIREFSQRNLFADPADVDAEWIAQCVVGSRDSRGRFATFSYLCGSIPACGAWRDDRGELFDSLNVPVQLLRGDYGGLENAVARANRLLARAPMPSRSCSAIVRGARQCVPYERAPATAKLLAKFVQCHFGPSGPADDAVTLDDDTVMLDGIESEPPAPVGSEAH